MDDRLPSSASRFSSMLNLRHLERISRNRDVNAGQNFIRLGQRGETNYLLGQLSEGECKGILRTRGAVGAKLSYHLRDRCLEGEALQDFQVLGIEGSLVVPLARACSLGFLHDRLGFQEMDGVG